jgi:hypothetical protein
MYLKQVRSKDNRYSTVEYDKDGNIILQTKAARKARAEERKKEEAKKQKLKTAVKCSAYTKKKKPCPNLVEESRGGTLCHIHDPGGIFRTQVAEKRKQHMK